MLPDELTKIAGALRAELLHRVHPKHAIAFELRFGKELVARAFVRKSFVALKVFVDITRFISVTRGLDVDENAVRCFAPSTMA